jgi:hypothetical protein
MLVRRIRPFWRSAMVSATSIATSTPPSFQARTSSPTSYFL